MCLFCFSDDPHPDDKFAENHNTFEKPMCDAGPADPMCCCLGFCCPCIPAMLMRDKYLELSGEECKPIVRYSLFFLSPSSNVQTFAYECRTYFRYVLPESFIPQRLVQGE